jgi:hypothetical protein
MKETPVALGDIAALTALSQGILPADDRDAGAAIVHCGAAIAEKMRRSPHGEVYVDGIRTAQSLAREQFGRMLSELDPAEMHHLLTGLREQRPMFFRFLRADVCSLYLSDPGVWRRIGFPGPASDTGGYPDFDQPPSDLR